MSSIVPKTIVRMIVSGKEFDSEIIPRLWIILFLFRHKIFPCDFKILKFDLISGIHLHDSTKRMSLKSSKSLILIDSNFILLLEFTLDSKE